MERCGYAEPVDENNLRGNYYLNFAVHDLGYQDQGGGCFFTAEHDCVLCLFYGTFTISPHIYRDRLKLMHQVW